MMGNVCPQQIKGLKLLSTNSIALLGLLVFFTNCTVKSAETASKELVEEATSETVSTGLGSANNIDWSSEATTETGASKTTVKLTASIGDGWHLYSQFLDSDEGPLPTVFAWKGETLGATMVKELSAVHEELDPNFGVNVRYFEKEALFEFEVPSLYSEISGTLSYMVCNDETCLPPVDLEVTIPLK